jgi:hypothetical protein
MPLPTALKTDGSLDLGLLARLGAGIHLAQLVAEMDSIEHTFFAATSKGPQAVRDERLERSIRARLAKAELTAVSKPVPKPRRRRMSTAERKEVSERMTRYWTAWRARKGRTNGAKRRNGTGRTRSMGKK